jgi:transglutaminase-like putative cysteine protease
MLNHNPARSMNYSIRHTTRFEYSAPVYESFMEVRKCPRTEGNQRVQGFSLAVSPNAHVFHYVDFLGNVVNTFDIPRAHNRLIVTAEAYVEIIPVLLPPLTLPAEAWAQLDREVEAGDFWDMLMPSQYIDSTPNVTGLAEEMRASRRDDPLTVLRELNQAIYDKFDYVPNYTNVDSHIDEAITSRKGVCQDFAHIMISMVRPLGIPCRYISGYLYTGKEDADRSAQDATHAWVEAWLPGCGWIGFDPTNNLIASDRHIRVAIGRDYADVPPTHGVFRGEVESSLSVGVQVKIADNLPFDDAVMAINEQPIFTGEIAPDDNQQQQQ